MLCPSLNSNSSRILKLYTLDKFTSNMYNGIITITLVLYNVQVQKMNGGILDVKENYW